MIALFATSSFSVQRVGQNFKGNTVLALNLTYRSLLAGESWKNFDIARKTYKEFYKNLNIRVH